MRIRQMLIVVAAIVFSAGAAFARHRSAPAVPSVEVEGVVKTISPTQVVVTVGGNHDVTVAIAADTIFRRGDTAIAPTDFGVGDRVEVKAVMKDGVLTAVLIKLENEENEHPEFVEINGVIKSVSPTELVVTDAHHTDITVVITSDTMIRKGDHAATTGDIAVGDRVEVKATVNGGVNTAVLIHAEGAEPELAEINGVIKSVSSTELVVTDAHHTDITVMITPDTMIRKGDHAAATVDLAVGDRAEVKATVSGGVNTAVSIHAEAAEPPRQEANVNGAVTAVGSDQITVHGRNGDVVVKTDSNTRIRRDDHAIAVSDIHIGDRVEAQGNRIDDHSMLARSIELLGAQGHH